MTLGPFVGSPIRYYYYTCIEIRVLYRCYYMSKYSLHNIAYNKIFIVSTNDATLWREKKRHCCLLMRFWKSRSFVVPMKEKIL